jgi:DNA repair protein RecN (Recombination protein N)
VPVSELATLLAGLRTRLEALDAGAGEVATLEAAEAKARGAYFAAAGKLSAARRKAASRTCTSRAAVVGIGIFMAPRSI